MIDLADCIVAARTLVGDSATSNLLRSEQLNNPDVGNVIGGGNTIFQLTNFPIVSVVQFVVDGVVISSGGYSIDLDTGIVTFNVAPTQTALATYYFYLMSDDDWTQFVEWAVGRVGYATNNGIILDIQQVPDSLLSAVKTLAASAWCSRVAMQTGLWYNQRLQERIEDRDTISSKFAKMAQAFAKDGDTQRDSYYQGQGKQFKPSFTVLNHTPKLYTPYR